MLPSIARWTWRNLTSPSRPGFLGPAARIVLAGGISAIVFCQIPQSERLAPGDVKPFHDEVRRIEHMLDTAGDKCAVVYALARTWAAGGQYREAMRALEKAAALKVGLDPANDSMFAKLRGSSEFERLLRQIRDDTPPVAHARVTFTVNETGLFPEGMAYDSRKNRFFLGSTFKHKILECTGTGACQPFVTEGQDGLSEVLGLKTNPNDGTLWAASNSAEESGLFHFSDSGKLIRKYTLSRKPAPHLFNDLVIDHRGSVFVTDSQAGTVYWVSRATGRLEIFNPALKVAAANGIAITEQDRALLYVAGFPEGITVVDIASGAFRAIKHPANLCLATIDGLYFYHDNLFAIQNGIMVHRVVRCHLTRDLNAIDRFEVLERRNPLFEGLTTGAVAEGGLYFMANTQLDKVADGKVKPDTRLNPVQILRIDLRR